jgi:hypothetical protein
MNDKELNNADEASGDSPADQSLGMELNFVPERARKPPQQAHYYSDKPARGQSRPRDRDRRDRPPQGRQQGRPQRRPQDRNAPRRPEHASRDRRRERPTVLPPPPVNVRFLPDQRQLSTLVKKIRATGRAYPVVDMAYLFLSNPTTCDVRIEVRADVSDVKILQCGKCGTVAMDRASLLAHVIDVHAPDHFDKEEQVSDPPAGKFVCVVRCGLSGILLGPPNHHSYEAKALEVHRTRYPNMPFSEYRDKGEQVHDEDVIEKWKEEFRTQTVYRMKGSTETEPMTWREVEVYMDKHVAPDLIRSGRRCDVNAAVAKDIKDQGLRGAVNAAWRAESAFPRHLSGALKGAFRHGQLYMFNAGRRRHTFVTATRPAPLGKVNVVESIREVITFIEEHPGCSRKDLLEGLRPGSAPDSPEARSTLSPLSWLTERGHIIEFFDDALAVPLRAAPQQKAPRHKGNRKRR